MQLEDSLQQMFPNPARTAREIACSILTTTSRDSGFLSQRIDKQLEGSELPAAARRLVTEIVYGVTRRRRTIDALIRSVLHRPPQSVERRLWTILQIGTYQLVFLSQMPPQVAVDQTVELANWIERPDWKQYVNGVLRGLGRVLTSTYSAVPTRNAVPLSSGRYRLVQKDLFADPEQNPKEYFGMAFSMPDWLVKRWARRFTFQELIQLGFWFNTPPLLTLRVNPLRTTREDCLQTLSDSGISVSPGELPESILIEGAARITKLPGFQEGWWSVQDESAMMVARMVDPAPGSRVLDLCAAPGGKSTHLAELMNNEGTVVACDVSLDRLESIQEASTRLGHTIIQVSPADQVPSSEQFDAVLLDVPCSNTGVLGKRVEARWRISASDLVELPELQQTILRRGAHFVRPGGKLIYSTCSIEPEENQGVVEQFLSENKSFQLAQTRESKPGQPSDGGFIALLERIEL